MTEKEYQKFVKRYDKFKNNNLPTPFWDEERQVKEYVYFDNGHALFHSSTEDDKLNVNDNLTESLGELTSTNLYYPFIDKGFIIENKNGKKNEKIIVAHNHAHSFDEVVNALYRSPESFKITKKDEKYYSTQELEYLKRVQKYLIFIGLKDVETNKINSKRYQNQIHKKYANAIIYKFDDKTIKNILNGKLNFKIIKWYRKANLKTFKPNEFQALIVDKNENFKLFIEFTHEEVKKYHEVKKLYPNKNFKDNDKVILMYFKILEIFK